MGHATCLIPMADKPDNVDCWDVSGAENLNGYYVPTNYQFVGKLSSPLFDDWTLTGIHVPEDLSDLLM